MTMWENGISLFKSGFHQAGMDQHGKIVAGNRLPRSVKQARRLCEPHGRPTGIPPITRYSSVPEPDTDCASGHWDTRKDGYATDYAYQCSCTNL